MPSAFAKQRNIRLYRVGIASSATWTSIVALVTGIFFGCLFGVLSLLTFGLTYGFTYIVRWIVWTPIIFCIIGFLTIAAIIPIYNILVRKKGGIVLHIEEVNSLVPERVRVSHIAVVSAAIWISLAAAIAGIGIGIVLVISYVVQFGVDADYLLRWLILTPIALGVIGFLATLISALIYNLVVRRKGGVILSFQGIGAAVPTPPPPPTRF